MAPYTLTIRNNPGILCKLTFVLSLLGFALSSQGQTINRYVRRYTRSNTDAVYNYSVSPAHQHCTSCTNYDEYITAGTLGLYLNGDTTEFFGKVIHFMHLEHDGKIKQCKPTTSPGVFAPASFFYLPDPAYVWPYKSNCITTFFDSPYDEAFIVTQFHLDTPQSGAINLMKIDNCTGDVIMSSTMSSRYRNLYATHAIRNANTYVQITGFSTDKLGGDKKLLFISYNIITNIVDAIEINTTTSTTLPFDFDMGLGIRALFRNPHRNFPLIVGSCNSENGSASIGILLNPSLAIDDIIYFQDTVDSHGEYAFDVDETMSGYFFLSNKYRQSAEAGPVTYKPEALYITKTFIKRNTSELFEFDLGGAGQRFHIKRPAMPDTSWAWGTHMIVENGVLSGVQSYPFLGCNLNGNTAPSKLEPVPFLARFNHSGSGASLAMTCQYWRTYHSQLSRSSYNRIGTQLHNMYWPIRFVTQNDNVTSPGSTTDMVVMASTYEDLVLKGFRVTDLGKIDISGSSYDAQCDSSAVTCSPIILKKNTFGGIPDYSWDTLILDVNNVEPEVFDDEITDTVECSVSGAFKSSSVKFIEDQIFALYPNPANKNLEITLASGHSYNQSLYVDLYDLTGKNISRLFTGSTTDFKPAIQLQLPNLSTGLYIIRISSQTGILHQEKLSIIR